MAVPNKKIHVSDEEAFYKLLRENEYTDISESEYSHDSEINVKISSGSEQFSSVSALMKQKMSETTAACNLAYGQIQVLRDVFHLLASLA
jgi:hypothetical protein